MQRTWKPVAAGVLSIISGGLTVIAALGAALYVVRYSSMVVSPAMTAAIVAALLAPAVVAIVGGACSIRRRNWGLALAGSICALVPPFITLGIVATVWTAISRSEFN